MKKRRKACFASFWQKGDLTLKNDISVPYRTLGSYLKETYGCEVGKICIDGGFTCPNRDGTVGYGGCMFCGERGAGEHLREGVSIEEQVSSFFSRPHRQKKFIAYFQNFTNTYAPADILRKRYTAALGDSRVIALAVGTRPDCIDGDVIRVLLEMKKRGDVWVELGLQTAHDDVAARFGRGYPTAVFGQAANLLREAGIPTVVHLMVGLPGDSPEGVRETADYVATLSPFGVKIHSVYVMDGTRLADLLRTGGYTPVTMEEYVSAVTYILSHLPTETVIHRLTGDCPDGRLLAPAFAADKAAVLRAIRARMAAEGWRQGCLRIPDRTRKAP